MKTMVYKGYVGSVEFSETDNVFYGKVQNVSGLISYEGKTKEELFSALSPAYVSGITFSGGDPLHKNNIKTVLSLIEEIKKIAKKN